MEMSMKPDLRAVDGVSLDVYEGQRSYSQTRKVKYLESTWKFLTDD